MIKCQNKDRTFGFLSLLLILLILSSLKPALHSSRPSSLSCQEHLFVQIAGDIKCPGVYDLCDRSDLITLIHVAGGLKSYANPPASFRDLYLTSGKKLLIQRDGDGWDLMQSEMSAFYKFTLQVPISLNSETEQGLTAIPGIGPGLGKAIVWERSRRGGFKSLDEILAISGISVKLFRKIKPYLSL